MNFLFKFVLYAQFLQQNNNNYNERNDELIVHLPYNLILNLMSMKMKCVCVWER